MGKTGQRPDLTQCQHDRRQPGRTRRPADL